MHLLALCTDFIEGQSEGTCDICTYLHLFALSLRVKDVESVGLSSNWFRKNCLSVYALSGSQTEVFFPTMRVRMFAQGDGRGHCPKPGSCCRHRAGRSITIHKVKLAAQGSLAL